MVIVRAPVRISFGGGGTDLAAYYARFGGLVVSVALARYCYVVASTPTDGGIRILSADYRSRVSLPPGELPAIKQPLALPKAAIVELADQRLRATGLDLVLASEVPQGTGLGSSSAMAVALVYALALLRGQPLDRAAVAEAACRIEIERLGMPIGKQDQYASAFGGLNVVEFAADGVCVRPLALPVATLTALGERLLLFSTGQTHNSSDILRQQRANTEQKATVIAALHHIKALAHEMRDALLAGELDAFGVLLDRSWREKRRLARTISTSAIDHWYAAARAAGATGGKIAGAGGGGFLLLYVPCAHQQSVRAAMLSCGLRELPVQFDFEGVRTLSELPSQPERSALPI